MVIYFIPRGENNLIQRIQEINDYVTKQLPSKYRNLFPMNNKNIIQNMLKDNKHLNKSGFFYIYSEFKVRYGEVPRRRLENNRNFGYRNYHRK